MVTEPRFIKFTDLRSASQIPGPFVHKCNTEMALAPSDVGQLQRRHLCRSGTEGHCPFSSWRFAPEGYPFWVLVLIGDCLFKQFLLSQLAPEGYPFWVLDLIGDCLFKQFLLSIESGIVCGR